MVVRCGLGVVTCGQRLGSGVGVTCVRETRGMNWVMPVNSTHLDYDAALPPGLRARDVIAGEDAVKAAGTRYLPRLNAQTEDEYAAYKARASFYNATARTAEGYLGLVFRRPPFVKLPEDGGGGNHKAEMGKAESRNRRAEGHPHPQPLSHPMGEGGVGLSPGGRGR